MISVLLFGCIYLIFEFFFSAPQVKFTETRKSLPHFLTQLCAILGGVFTVAGMLDRLVSATLALGQPASQPADGRTDGRTGGRMGRRTGGRAEVPVLRNTDPTRAWARVRSRLCCTAALASNWTDRDAVAGPG